MIKVITLSPYEWGFWMGSFLADGGVYPRFCGGGFIPGSPEARAFAAASDQHEWLLEFGRGMRSVMPLSGS